MIFFSLVKAEWTKTMRMRSTYIAFVAVMALVMLIEIGIYARGDHSNLARTLRAFDLKQSWVLNGYTSTQIALFVAFGILIVPMTIMTFARQIAGESAAGTLRVMLSRPISRFALINAKLVVCMLYALQLMAFFFLFAYGLGVFLFGWTESVTVPNGKSLSFARISPEFKEFQKAQQEKKSSRNWLRDRMFDYKRIQAGLAIRSQLQQELKKLLISPVSCAKRLALAWLLTSWALFTFGSLGLIFSVLNRHAIAAMALTIGTFFLVLIVQVLASDENVLIPLFTSIEPYLFTKAMGYWSACYRVDIDWHEIKRGFLLLGAYTAVFYVIAQWLFWRRDITS